MSRNPIETVMGAVVLLVAGSFLAFAVNSANLRPVSGYAVKAVFNKVGGLTVGSDVRISGIKVGSVTGQSLDPRTYRAVVTLSILPDVKLPADTVASVASDGLLGGKFVKLEPGQSGALLENNAALSRTRDYQSVEDLVSELIFIATKDPPPGAPPGGAPGLVKP
ncbi:outer membrane lipid asymmetry maintenance protein MlaD [Novispirillum itersonii]|uniref:outer membrane lipid asymmetry maintenance protein MlaD n=1 Tax=Novispirillum itersonii TaxID=189 RepID=UPI00037376B1|nr:outer membrane lipid asymmetry maintenance protein MlaD [Novispirillum itersonii]